MIECFEYYEVRRIAADVLVYRGKSLTKAATGLEPGTCYGKGPTPREAHEHARVAVRKHRGRNSLDVVGRRE